MRLWAASLALRVGLPSPFRDPLLGEEGEDAGFVTAPSCTPFFSTRARCKAIWHPLVSLTDLRSPTAHREFLGSGEV